MSVLFVTCGKKNVCLWQNCFANVSQTQPSNDKTTNMYIVEYLETIDDADRKVLDWIFYEKDWRRETAQP